MLTPRPYQLDLVARARAAFLGTRSVLAVLPTGGGKTQVGSMVVEGGTCGYTPCACDQQ